MYASDQERPDDQKSEQDDDHRDDDRHGPAVRLQALFFFAHGVQL
jgi:hypothetical protein